MKHRSPLSMTKLPLPLLALALIAAGGVHTPAAASDGAPFEGPRSAGSPSAAAPAGHGSSAAQASVLGPRAARSRVRLSVATRGRLMTVNADPNLPGRGSYVLRVSQLKNGRWAPVGTWRTQGRSEMRRIVLAPGRYRVRMPAQHGLPGIFGPTITVRGGAYPEPVAASRGEVAGAASRLPIGSTLRLPSTLVLAPLETPDHDANNRASMTSFWRRYLDQSAQAARAVQALEVGDTRSCDPGTPPAQHAESVLARVNWFRAAVGLPPVSMSAASSRRAQSAALMMAAQDSLSHDPPSWWRCYTTQGASTAGKSNLALRMAGPDAVSLQIDDPGSANGSAGHRRWLLHPALARIGTGDIVAANGMRANAISVLNGLGQRPASLRPVAWPAPGFFPRGAYPASRRWSFSLPPAMVKRGGFNRASVQATVDGHPVKVVRETPRSGYGDETLVWRLAALPGSGDTSVSITIKNIASKSGTLSARYNVTVFDPQLP